MPSVFDRLVGQERSSRSCAAPSRAPMTATPGCSPARPGRAARSPRGPSRPRCCASTAAAASAPRAARCAPGRTLTCPIRPERPFLRGESRPGTLVLRAAARRSAAAGAWSCSKTPTGAREAARPTPCSRPSRSPRPARLAAVLALGRGPGDDDQVPVPGDRAAGAAGGAVGRHARRRAGRCRLERALAAARAAQGNIDRRAGCALDPAPPRAARPCWRPGPVGFTRPALAAAATLVKSARTRPRP